MPEITPKLGLKKRLGNETVRRLDWNENYDQLDLMAAREPFLLKSYAYDSTNDQITLTMGPGRGSFLSSVVDKSADSIFTISAPVPNTTYFVFLKSDGTFAHNSTGSLIQNAVLLHSFATGTTVDVITPTDHRGEISGDAQSLSASLIPSTGNSNVQADIDNLKSSVSSGKQQVSGAITGKGGTVADADGDGIPSFQELSDGVNSIPQAQGDATVDEVIEGVTFTSAVYGAVVQTGTMPNNGSLGTITPGTANKSIPAGYTSGGTVLGDPDLVTANIKSGSNIFGVPGKTSVVETADATATSGQILNGQSAYVNGSKVTGSMPNNGAVTINPGTADQTIPAGYHSGSGKVTGDPDLVTGNIRAGANIFGVAGKTEVVDTTEATAPTAAGNILSGKVGFVNGTKVVGSMPNNGALGTYTPTTTNQNIPAGYTSGGTVAGDADLVAENIRGDKNIFGVQGSIPIQAAVAQTITPGTTNVVKAAGIYDGDLTIVGDADLVSANIKSGANIFGVAGKSSVVETADATAVAGNILSGKTSYVNGAKVTGTIPSVVASTITPGTANKTAIAAGNYASGAITVAGDPDLTAANIKSGVDIFGVLGSMGSIKSLQVVTVALTNQKTKTATIASVDPNSTIIIPFCPYLQNIGYGFNVELTNATTITMNSYNTSSSEIDYVLYVIEFENVKSKQVGAVTGDGSAVKWYGEPNPYLINIASVDPSKCLAIATMSCSSSGGGAFATAQITTATQLSVRMYGGFGNYGTLKWQVLEFE